MITMKNQFKKNSCNSDACTKSKFFSQDNDVPTVMEKNAPQICMLDSSITTTHVYVYLCRSEYLS